MKPILLAATISISFFSACNNSKTSAAKAYLRNSNLNGTWELIYLTRPQNTFDGLYPERKPRIIFEVAGNRVSGNTSCNSFSGPLIINGNKIDLTRPMILTKMFCPGEGENVFLEILKKIDSWSVTDGTTLNFIMDDVNMMQFRKMQ
jgi:heat shock protein HslJ